eukprot:335528-Prymnesium_polylepis.1
MGTRTCTQDGDTDLHRHTHIMGTHTQQTQRDASIRISRTPACDASRAAPAPPRVRLCSLTAPSRFKGDASRAAPAPPRVRLCALILLPYCSLAREDSGVRRAFAVHTRSPHMMEDALEDAPTDSCARCQTHSHVLLSPPHPTLCPRSCARCRTCTRGHYDEVYAAAAENTDAAVVGVDTASAVDCTFDPTFFSR